MKYTSNNKVTAELAREETFGLAGVKFTLPDGRIVFLTMAQVEILKEEIAEYDAERKRK